MFKSLIFSTIALIILLSSCQNRNAIDDIESIPEYQESDQVYADVFKMLDGIWNGQFRIYEDQKTKPLGELDLINLSANSIQKDGIVLTESVDVKQVYTSESPFFQRVTITDSYPDSDKVVQSKGVNKIQNGKMWCVVKKPGETILHEGSLKDTNTIIWQSDTKEKKEYFYETVTKQYYEIIGWGYYGDNDRTMSPRYWFYGKYERK